MSKVKEVIFDFDGTIADTFPTVKDIIEKLLPKMGFGQFDEADWELYYNGGAKMIFKKMGVNLLQLMLIIRRMQAELNKRLGEVKPFEGIGSTIEKLKAKGIGVGIVSSDTKKNVEEFLERENIGVDLVITGVNIFGKDRLINKYLKQRGLKKEDVVYVGDEIRDIEACRKIGVRVVGVTWGFNSKKALVGAQADWVVEKPADLAKIIKVI